MEIANQNIDIEVVETGGETAQYFWHNTVDSGAGEGAGAHITQIPQEDFVADPANGGGNTLITTNGMAVRDGLEELAVFSADEIRIGAIDDAKTVIKSGNTTLYTADQVPAFVVDSGSGSTIQLVNSNEYIGEELTALNQTATKIMSKLSNVAIGDTFIIRTSFSTHFQNGSPTGYSWRNDETEFTKASTGTFTETKTLSFRGEDLTYTIKYTAPNSISVTPTNITVGIPAGGDVTVISELYYYELVSDAQVKITSDTDINRVLNDISWNDVLKDGMLELRTLVEKLLTRAQDLFLVTTETFSYPAISSGSGSGVRTATFSNTGYYPVGIMGFRTGNSAAVPTRLNLSSRSSGSATLSYVLRAVSAVSAGSGDVDILWVKE